MKHGVCNTLNLFTRVAFFSWIVLITLISIHIAATQLLPGRWWLKPYGVRVVTGADNQPWVAFDRHVSSTRQISRTVVLSDADNSNRQPCIGVTQEVEDRGTQTVSNLLAQVLPFCNFKQLDVHREWQLHVYWTISLDYGIDKTVGIDSKPFRLHPVEYHP